MVDSATAYKNYNVERLLLNISKLNSSYRKITTINSIRNEAGLNKWTCFCQCSYQCSCFWQRHYKNGESQWSCTNSSFFFFFLKQIKLQGPLTIPQSFWSHSPSVTFTCYTVTCSSVEASWTKTRQKLRLFCYQIWDVAWLAEGQMVPVKLCVRIIKYLFFYSYVCCGHSAHKATNGKRLGWQMNS